MSERHVTVDLIIEAVCASTGCSRLDILSERRPADLCVARFAVYWLADKLTTLSASTVGRLVGDRDPTTVLSGRKRAEELRASDPSFRIATDALHITLTTLESAGVQRLAASADPLATARRVLAAPQREAVRVPVAEIIALCRFVADAAAQPSPVMENSDAV